MRRGSVIWLIVIVTFIVLTLVAVIIPFALFKAIGGSGPIAQATGISGGLCSNVSEPYGTIFRDAGNKYGVQPAFIAAIFVGEHPSIKSSGYKTWPNASGPWASSPVGASGPFQFMPGTWKGYQTDGDGDGKMDIQSLVDSGHGAAKKLGNDGAGGMSTDDARLRDAASKYNSGRKWEKGQAIKETKRYVDELVMPSFSVFYCDNSTTLVSGVSSKTGNDGVPFFSQNDYKNVDYAPGTSIAEAGCCPTSAAMILRFYGFNADPVSISQFSYQKGAYVPGQGTDHHKLVPLLAKKFNIKSENLGKDWNKALTHLANGHPLMAAGTGAAPYTGGGHCIVLTGYDAKTGIVRVNDPARSPNAYPLTLLQKETRVMYFLGK